MVDRLRRVFPSLASSFTVLVLLTWILNLRWKYIFAPLAAAATFFFCLYLTEVQEAAKSHGQPSARVFLSVDDRAATRIMIVGYGLCILVVYLTPAFDERYILEWSSIPVWSWVRLAASMPLLIFLPGYTIFYALMRERRDTLETFSLSYLFSVFLNPLITFLVRVKGVNPIDSKPLLLIFHTAMLAAILLLYLFRLRGKPKRACLAPGICKEKAYEYCALLFLALVVLAASYRFFNLPPYLMGDQWSYFGDAISFFRSGNLVDLMHWDWFFTPFLASFFVLSGFPPANGYFALNFLTLVPFLSFYLLVRTLFEDRRLQLLTMLFTLFSGFGWAFFIYLRDIYRIPLGLQDTLYTTSLLTYDVWISNTYLISSMPDLNHPLHVMAFPALMIGIYASKSLKPSLLRFVATAVAMTLAYAAHFAEAGMLASIMFLLSLFNRNAKESSLDGAAFLMGLSVIYIIDYLFPIRIFTSSPVYYAVLAVSAMTLFVSLIARSFLRGRTTHINLDKRIVTILAIAITILFIICFTTWLSKVSDLGWSYTIWNPDKVYTVSWFIYPTRFGVTMILAAVGLVYILSRNVGLQRFSFFTALSLVSAVLGFAVKLPAASKVLILDEHRQNKYLAVGLSGFASHGTLALLSSLRRRPGGTLCGPLLLGLIVVSGISSPLLYVEFNLLAYTGPNYFFHSHALSLSEIDAIEWLRLNLPTARSVAIIGPAARDSREQELGGNYFKLAWLEGIDRSMFVSMEDFIKKGDAIALAQCLTERKVRYIYLTMDDYTSLQQQALKHNVVALNILKLKRAFSNDKAVILDTEGLGG